jgi:hypothetical protein
VNWKIKYAPPEKKWRWKWKKPRTSFNPEQIMRFAHSALLCAILIFLQACSFEQPGQNTYLALNGPPLSLAGRRISATATDVRDLPLELEGSMERSCMVGLGEIELTAMGLRCKGKINSAPSGKGRIKAVIPCENSMFLLLTLSNRGPDQGMGLAHFAGADHPRALREPASTEENNPPDGQPDTRKQPAWATGLEVSVGPALLLFYHPWDKEAARRLREALIEMADSLEKIVSEKSPGNPPEGEISDHKGNSGEIFFKR